jgi:hypothetical protein
MLYPDGSWNETTKFWNWDGPMLRPGPNIPAAWLGEINSTTVTDLIGTGMFILKTVDPNEQIWTWETNDNYWGGAWYNTLRPGPIKPPFDNLIMRAYPDESAYYSAALAGDVDYFILRGATGPDYVETIENSTDYTLAPPVPFKSNQYFTLDIYLLNLTVRRAMSFAFNYDHYIENIGGFLERHKGPGQSGMLYAWYADNNQRTFPNQVENGFNYNITEARRILLEETTAATDRGLDANSDDADWVAVSASDNPIQNITIGDHATNPNIYLFLKTYWNAIGIQCHPYGPIAAGDVYPYEMVRHRWAKDVQWMASGHMYPHMFAFYYWYFNDWQNYIDADGDGIVNMFDTNWTQQLNWNQWALLSSDINFNESDYEYVREIQPNPDPDYVPTSTNLRQLIASFEQTLETVPMATTPEEKAAIEEQLTNDVTTFLDYIYRQAISIWHNQPVKYYAYNPNKWALPDWFYCPTGNGMFMWDLIPVGEPFVIPGYPMGIFIGISLAGILAVAVITRKRKIE